MDDITRPPRSTSIDPDEAAHFRRLADTWWDEEGPFWPLHALNALRTPWITERACRHFGRARDASEPLRGLEVLDIGCGGGLLSESMARLGATVHGIDIVDRNIAIAREHADGQGLPVSYELVTVEDVAAQGREYDVVLNMEVVEHVADLPGFMAASSAVLRSRGLLFLATINRTPKAWLFAVFGAEYVLRWLPRGTHHWRLLRKPREIEALLARDGLEIQDRTGVAANPFRKSLSLTASQSVNYMLSASRPSSLGGSGTG